MGEAPAHDLMMPHDVRYPDDVRGCPPNCPYRRWAEAVDPRAKTVLHIENPTGRLACPDGGKCHHQCKVTESCFRVRACGPLSGVFEDNRWPADVLAAELAVEHDPLDALTRCFELAADWAKSVNAIGKAAADELLHAIRGDR